MVMTERLGTCFPTQAAGSSFATYATSSGTRCRAGWAAEHCGSRVPVNARTWGWGGVGWGVPAVSQVTDLSSVPIDKAQHRRAPEISQQRDKRQKSHTVRWCANCLWLLTSPTPAGWISVVQSSPPASGPVCGVWTHKSLGAMGQVTVYLLGHIRWHTYILYIRCNDCSICKHTIMNLLYYWVT